MNSDVVIIGSGFAGALLAQIVRRLELSVTVIDSARHPRFAIGESSTPIGNAILRALAQRYELPWLLPLCEYGTWRAAHPELGVGPKRGFSYFVHEPGQPYRVRDDHQNLLLVTANRDDFHCDTHWLRADLDHFLVRHAARLGANIWEDSRIESIEHDRGWKLTVTTPDGQRSVRARLLVDASGNGGVLPRTLGLADTTSRLQTDSRALFSHFCGVGDWTAALRAGGAQLADYPFDADRAAQHHVLRGAWCWMLRFAHGITSVGIAVDRRRLPATDDRPADVQWREWLQAYPAVAALLDEARIVSPPGKIVATGRLQRRWASAAGEDWLLLPNTAGFVDPLHSTGIAHSLSGVERVAAALQDAWQRPAWATRMDAYQRGLLQELDWIDALVATCYRTMERPRLFHAACMIYFAAATTYERRRLVAGRQDQLFLAADEEQLTLRARNWASGLPDDPADEERSVQQLAAELEPYNGVGLFDPAARNLYWHTAAPVGP